MFCADSVGVLCCSVLHEQLPHLSHVHHLRKLQCWLLACGRRHLRRFVLELLLFVCRHGFHSWFVVAECPINTYAGFGDNHCTGLCLNFCYSSGVFPRVMALFSILACYCRLPNQYVYGRWFKLLYFMPHWRLRSGRLNHEQPLQ